MSSIRRRTRMRITLDSTQRLFCPLQCKIMKKFKEEYVNQHTFKYFLYESRRLPVDIVGAQKHRCTNTCKRKKMKGKIKIDQIA